VVSRAVCLKETLVPDVEGPDDNEDDDEIWPEYCAHDGNRLDLIDVSMAPEHGSCFRTGTGGVEDVESSGSLARAHLERGENFFLASTTAYLTTATKMGTT
jgi:hypothetical protein